MSIITGIRCSASGRTEQLRNIYIAVVILGSWPCSDGAPAAESGPGNRPMLQVPRTNSKLVVDGKLEEPCWKHAA